jgi:hypothetical protein
MVGGLVNNKREIVWTETGTSMYRVEQLRRAARNLIILADYPVEE